jgi:hypothetical protein
MGARKYQIYFECWTVFEKREFLQKSDNWKAIIFTCEIIINNLTCEIISLSVLEISIKHYTLHNKDYNTWTTSLRIYVAVS